MSLVVNTNVGSLNAQRSLASSGAELKTAMERLSSGKKINSAADDAAGFAIAERMTAQIRGLNMATKNANDGLSMLAVIENATNDVTDMLQRMRELAIQAANDTNGSVDRAFLQEEVSQLIQEIDRVATQTQYNGQVLLDGSFQNKSIQVGTEAGQTVGFSIDALSSGELGGVSQVQEVQEANEEVVAQVPLGEADFLYAWGAGTGSQIAFQNSQIVDGYLDSGGLQSGDILVVEGQEFTVDSFTLYAAGAVPLVNENGLVSESTDLESYRGSFGMLFVNVNTGGGSQVAGYEGPGRSSDISATNTLTVEKKVVDHSSATSGGDQSSGPTTDSPLSLESINLTENASGALDTISQAIDQVSGQRATLGALQNRLEYTVSNLMNVAEFTTSARSRIEDADFAAESARLAKAQVLQQTGTAMLAQANAQPQLALSLIR